MTLKETFAKNLSSALKSRKMSQKQLAGKKTGTEGTISKYLDPNNPQLPNADRLAHIAQELDVSTDWLLGLSQRQRTEEQLTLHDIGKVLIQCVNTPALNLRFDEVSSDEFYNDDESPEPGEYKKNVRRAISFCDHFKVDEYDPCPYYDHYAPYGAALNSFIDNIVTFHELYIDGKIKLEMYKRLLRTALDELSKEPLPPSILDSAKNYCTDKKYLA